MSISIVGSASDSYSAAPKSGSGPQGQNLNEIANALQVGNLAGARKALSAFLQSPPASAAPGAASGILSGQNSKNVQALATALNFGDLPASAQAFRALRQEVQSARKPAQPQPQNNGESASGDASGPETPGASEAAAETPLSAFRLDAQA
jgi:hypothetical protein